MTKEYFLIAPRSSEPIIDKIICQNLREAETEFKKRNSFENEINKNKELVIAQALIWF